MEVALQDLNNHVNSSSIDVLPVKCEHKIISSIILIYFIKLLLK